MLNEFLLCKKPVLSIFLQLSLKLLFFGVLGPVELGLFHNVHILTLVVDESY